ncbi:hypothetical protein [Hanstruepera marina]|uniref:hypothetical protein n=1 Tax=Hanstruepera marina TaxID=2873265 RepID=UPI001CA6E12B|nr:hypothetical protein [Hanstruepera marina]
MKKLLLNFLVFFFTFNIQGQEKTYLDYLNEIAFTYPGCENAEDKDSCFEKAIGNLIINELNKSEVLFDKEIIKLLIRVDNLGNATVLENEVENQQLKLITHKALENIPIIEPAFSKEKSKPITRSWGFYVRIKREEGKYSLMGAKTKFDPKNTPYPNLADWDFKHAVCEGCEKAEDFKKCFKIAINNLLYEQLKKSKFIKHKISSIVEININENGIINTVISHTGNTSLDKKIEKIIKNDFIIIKPAKRGETKINVSYSIPIEINI